MEVLYTVPLDCMDKRNLNVEPVSKNQTSWLISHMLMENIVPSVLTPASIYIWCRWDISGWRGRAGPKAPFCCP